MEDVTDRLLAQFEFRRKSARQFGNVKWVNRIPKSVTDQEVEEMVFAESNRVSTPLIYGNWTVHPEKLVRALLDGKLRVLDNWAYNKYQIVKPNKIMIQPMSIEQYRANAPDPATLPDALKSGHEYLVKYHHLASKSERVKSVIDLYLDKYSQWRSNNKPASTPKAKKRNAKKPTPTKTCPPVDRKGERRIDPKGLELLQECIEAQPDTKEANTDTLDEYTQKRKELHDKIVQEFKDQKPCVVQQKPIAILTGGPPGSGKSTFLKKYAPWITSGKLFHIDADEIRAKLPEYKGWNADKTQAETSDLVKRMLSEIGSPCEFDLIYDGTMNKAKNYLPLIEQLKSMGYLVFVIYIQVPKELSIKRAMARYKKSGRYVPLSVIEEVYDRGLEAFETVIKSADGYIRVDNACDGPKIIEKGGMTIPEDREYKQFNKNEGECPCDHAEETKGEKTKRTNAVVPLSSKKGTTYLIKGEEDAVTITGTRELRNKETKKRKRWIKFQTASGEAKELTQLEFMKAVKDKRSELEKQIRTDMKPEESLEIARKLELTKPIGSRNRDQSQTSKKVYAPTPGEVKAHVEGKPGDLSGVDTKDQRLEQTTVHEKRDRNFMLKLGDWLFGPDTQKNG